MLLLEWTASLTLGGRSPQRAVFDVISLNTLGGSALFGLYGDVAGLLGSLGA